MAYVPNPVDPTEPVDGRGAGTASAEFRALKAYIQTLIINAGKSVSVRQTALQGVVDSNGFAAFLGAGAGLTLNLTAAARALVIAFAAGFNSTVGAIDSYSQLTNDVAGAVAALSANNTSYITADFIDTASVTWGKYLVPPQYDYAFDRTRGALLNFEGADASVVMLDDFGNTWTPVANAQIDTAQFKFGTSSLLLDGTGDYIESTNYTSLGADSWEISCWFRPNSVAGISIIFAAMNAASFGAVLVIDNNAASPRIRMILSSDSTTDNIASAGLGTVVIAVNTWYKTRLVFDALAGTYRIYLSVNGAAETQELTVSSTLRICGITRVRIGNGGTRGGVIEWNGWIDAFRIIRAATVTATEVPAAVAPAIADYPYHFFSIPEMKMYEVTAASVAAGTNPTITARNRVFLGEADTSGAGVTAVRNYAIRGQYESAFVTPLPGTATAVSLNHLLGVQPRYTQLELECISADLGFVVGDRIVNPFLSSTTDTAPANICSTSKTIGYTTGNSVAFAVFNKSTGVSGTPTVAKWKYRLTANRGF